MIISLQNIKKSYTVGESSFYVLNGISLDIAKGEMLAVIGRSGSGKSTLMNILGCLDIPSEGKYYLNGQDVSLMSQKELSYIRNNVIGFIFQSFNLIPTLNSIENVELPLLYRGISKHERQKAAIKALTAVDMQNRMYHKPSQLSGGQQQRVAIARAIAADPDVILADEPTGNLDKESSDIVMRLITQLNQKGKTVILITHDSAVANIAARRINIADNHSLKG